MHKAEQFILPGVGDAVPVLELPKKPVYSYSQVDTGKCGARYFNKYVQKKREPITFNLAAGSIADTAVNAYYYNNDHLVETHEQRLGYSRAAVDQLITDHKEWYEMEWSKKAGDPRSSVENYLAWLYEIKNKEGKVALDWICRVDRGPVKVQHELKLELPEYIIVGYVDLFEQESKTIVDIKVTTGWSDTTPFAYAIRSQVVLYQMLYKDLFGEETKGRYELLLAKRNSELQVLDLPLMETIQRKVLSDFDRHHTMVSKKDFRCNTDKCLEYNRVCPFYFSCFPELKPVLTKIKEQK